MIRPLPTSASWSGYRLWPWSFNAM